MFGMLAGLMDSSLRRAGLAGGGGGMMALPAAGGGEGGEPSALLPWTAPAGALTAGAPLFAPPLDIHEHSDAYELTVECPGLTEGELDVFLAPGGAALTITAKPHGHGKVTRDRHGRVVRRERYSSAWSRTLALPEDARVEEGQEAGLQASLERGVLHVVVPRKASPPEAAERAPKRIAIMAGGAGAGAGGAIAGGAGGGAAAADKPEAAAAKPAAGGGEGGSGGGAAAAAGGSPKGGGGASAKAAAKKK
jgi:HSP20 family molecular chaperone IbpA